MFSELDQGKSLFDVLKADDIQDFANKINKSINNIIRFIIDKNIATIHSTEAKTLFNYSRRAKGTIVEIGTRTAGTVTILGLRDPGNSNRIYSVDAVQTEENYKQLKQFGLFCNLIEGDSYEVGKKWDKGHIGLLFINSKHTGESLYK